MYEKGVRIVQFYPFGLRDIGGVAMSFRSWSEGLASAGAQVVGVTAGGPRPDASRVEWSDLEFRRIGPLRLPVGFRTVLRSADVLVCHSAWSAANAAACSVSRKASTPYVLTPHGGYDPHLVARRTIVKKPWFWALERPLLRSAAAVHVFFEDEKEHLAALGYRGDFIVAPNPITPPPVEGRDPNGYLLWWGRLDVEHKGLDLLVRAIRKVPHARLVMHGVGSDSERGAVEQLIRENRAEGQISLLPPVRGDEKWRVLAGAAAFVFPSRWDSHSIAVMEAAAAGTPIVASEATFVGRYLAREGGAFLVANDELSLAAGIERAMSSDGHEVGAAARRVARERFSPEAVAPSFLEQLRSLA